MAKSAPEHPSVQTLSGYPDAEILKVVEQVYRQTACSCTKCTPLQTTGWVHEGAVSMRLVLDAHGQGWFYRVRLGQSRPTSRGQRCSHSCSISQACSPSAGPWGTEVAKWLREDTPTGQSESKRHSCFSGRDKLRWHQSPSPQHDQACTSPPHLTPHEPILQTIGSPTLWRTSTCKQDPTNPGAECMVTWCPHTSWGEMKKHVRFGLQMET